MALDRMDIVLLELMQEDPRRTVKELAAGVGLSPSATHARVQRLLADGVVTGFRVDLDPRAIGVGLQAILQVQLRRHVREVLEAFRAHALSLREVIAVTHLTGPIDFAVHVAVRDPDHLRDLAMESFTTRDEVARIETSIVYEHLRARSWPIYTLDDDRRARAGHG